eukprot:362268-Chlamydomonas_euryale.AAC.1
MPCRQPGARFSRLKGKHTSMTYMVRRKCVMCTHHKSGTLKASPTPNALQQARHRSAVRAQLPSKMVPASMQQVISQAPFSNSANAPSRWKESTGSTYHASGQEAWILLKVKKHLMLLDPTYRLHSNIATSAQRGTVNVQLLTVSSNHTTSPSTIQPPQKEVLSKGLPAVPGRPPSPRFYNEYALQAWQRPAAEVHTTGVDASPAATLLGAKLHLSPRHTPGAGEDTFPAALAAPQPQLCERALLAAQAHGRR